MVWAARRMRSMPLGARTISLPRRSSDGSLLPQGTSAQTEGKKLGKDRHTTSTESHERSASSPSTLLKERVTDVPLSPRRRERRPGRGNGRRRPTSPACAHCPPSEASFPCVCPHPPPHPAPHEPVGGPIRVRRATPTRTDTRERKLQKLSEEHTVDKTRAQETSGSFVPPLCPENRA